MELRLIAGAQISFDLNQAPDQNSISCFSRQGLNFRFGSILLQKSFRGSGQKFLDPLMRFMCGDVRDHIASSKIGHGPPWWR